MRRNNEFFLKRIADKTYILPVGQMVADHYKSVLVNSVGEYIWNLLDDDISVSEIKQKCINFFEASKEEESIVCSDIDSFIGELTELGMILEGMKEKNLEFIKNVKIADIVIGFYGDKNCLTDAFDAFETGEKNGKADLRIEFIHDYVPMTLNGKTIIRNAPLEVMECEDRYILNFPESREIVECQMNKEGNLVRFHTYSQMSDEGKELLFHAIRNVFLYKALKKGIVAIHSVSIDYKGKAWLFSASSGTGKSTHASLWNKLYDTPVINGDLNLLGMKDGKPAVFGLPWCGTSNTYSNKEYELGGIFLLKRNTSDFVEELSDSDRILLVQKRLISPSWDFEMTNKELDIVTELVKNIKVVVLNCTKNDEAARVMKEYIDQE